MNATHPTRAIAAFLATLLLAGAAGPIAAQGDPRDALLGKQFLKMISSRPIKDEAADDELVKLLKARHNVALEGLKESHRDFQRNLTEVDTVFDAARRLVDSRLDLAQTPEAKLEVYEQVLDILAELEEIYRGRVKTLGGGESDLIRIRYARLSAEIESLRLKRSVGGASSSN